MVFDLEHVRSLVDQRLQELVPESNAPYKTLFSAARYSLHSSGKRLRPILMLGVIQMFGGSIEAALTPAAAIEMIHTYSLIHDDLPCMDNDDFRRGIPTLHKVYPEAIALLAGDFLLTRAFEVVTTCHEIEDLQKLELLRLLTSSAGGEGMIGGQVMDMESENKQIDLKTLECLHRKKTGILISTAIECGAVLAKLPQKTRSLLVAFGQELGLAFQIADDLLDITQGIAKHGKVNGSDSTNLKSTYVSLLGKENAKQELEKKRKQIGEILNELPVNPQILLQLSHMAIPEPL